MESLSEALKACRQEAGYTSSRAFFLRNGGAQHFGCTYRQYLNVENGVSAPSPKLVERIALGLRLTIEPEKAQAFFRAYIQCMIGREDLCRLVMKALSHRSTHRRVVAICV